MGGEIVRCGDLVIDLDAIAAAISEVVDDHFGQVAEEHQHAFEALFTKHLDDVSQKGLVEKLDHRLRNRLGDGTEPSTASSGKDDRLGRTRARAQLGRSRIRQVVRMSQMTQCPDSTGP